MQVSTGVPASGPDALAEVYAKLSQIGRRALASKAHTSSEPQVASFSGRDDQGLGMDTSAQPSARRDGTGD